MMVIVNNWLCGIYLVYVHIFVFVLCMCNVKERS